MIPKAIRVFPLSKGKEPQVFGTMDKVRHYFLKDLPSRRPPGRFNIRNEASYFEKTSLILFQYAEKKDEEKIIGHALLLSDGCVRSNTDAGYIGYYPLDLDSVVIYSNPVTKEEIYKIWGKPLCQAKLILDISKYGEYMRLLEKKGIVRSDRESITTTIAK